MGKDHEGGIIELVDRVVAEDTGLAPVDGDSLLGEGGESGGTLDDGIIELTEVVSQSIEVPEIGVAEALSPSVGAPEIGVAEAVSPSVGAPEIRMTEAAIEEAVRKVVSEMVGGKMDRLVADAIERAVAGEINRLKALLAGDRGN